MNADTATTRRSTPLRQWAGPLTRQLVREPAGFGLGQLPANAQPNGTTTAVCGFCSTGCGLNIHLKDGEAIGLSPTTDYPVNLGMACPKGWEALDVLRSSDRATTPYVRGARGRLVPTDWDSAMRTMCANFKTIQQKHGPESVAFLSTGQIVTEEMALLGALAKFGMGMVHGDGNTRQCMATAVVAYKQSFGFDAPPYTYQDFEESDVIVLVGSNLCIAHPIMWERVCRNPHDPKIIVVDPRKTETAMAATHHLALSPKSDLHLFYGLAHILIREGWIDRPFIDAHTNKFDAFAEHVQPFTPQVVSERSGIDVEQLETVAGEIAKGKRVSFWWTMGVNQSYEGVRLAQAIINLALMTGNIGRPGTGANSITGQCNAMGSRLFSNTTNLLGGRDFENADDRKHVADVIGIDLSRIPDRNSWSYHQIVEGIASQKIKGLWVIATNASHSWINQGELRDIVKNLDFLVVQDMYHSTQTAQQANLILPAAGWGEKDGTFINSERRIGMVKKIARAPGQALSDFAIFKLVAEYWGCAELFESWSSPEAVFEILKDMSRGQPCDFTGIEDYRAVDDAGGIQWPFTERDAQELGAHADNGHGDLSPLALANQRRLFEDGQFYHGDGRARFIFEAPRTMPEPADDEYPFTLLTGRGSAAQWHTQTRTSKSAVLRRLYPSDIYVHVNPADARALGVRPDQRVRVASRRGRLSARAFVTPTVQRGQVFISMHYEATNRLTNPVFDPYSKQPSYKQCAVKLRRIEHWENESPRNARRESRP